MLGEAPGQAQGPGQDAQAARLANAQAARDVANATQLSGSHDDAGHSRWAAGGMFTPSDIPGARHGVDWSTIPESGV